MKIFGKQYLLVLCITMCAQLTATVTLHIQNLEGQTVTQVAAGQPFMLQVTISDITGTPGEPILDGVDQFAVQHAGYQIMIINGVQSLQYKYQVRIDRPGTYTLGPARITQPAQSSAQQTIRVVAQQTQQASAYHGGKRYAQSQPIVELIVDHDHVYVGQPFRAIVRFIVSDAERISLEPFVPQSAQAITTYEITQPRQTQRVIDGKGYNQVELQMYMHATQAGRIVIPAQFLDYTKEAALDARLGGFATLFGPRYERKRAYSNAITMDVMPLPEHDEPVALVGQVTHFSAHIEPNVARQYEGLVLKLIAEGDAHFAALPAPELHQMPQELKYYPSKSYAQEDGATQRYVWEYIVQGLQPADLEIPAQQLTYFDTQTGTYKTKTTMPLFVTIVAGQSMSTQQSATIKQQEPEQSLPVQHATASESSPIAPLYTHIPTSLVRYATYYIPWWLLCIVLCICYALMHMARLRAYGNALAMRIAPAYMRSRFFAHLKRQCADALQAADYQAVQRLLMQAVAYLTGCQQHVCSQEQMFAYADRTQWPLEKKERWKQFLQQLGLALYAHQAEQPQQLLVAAELWLDELERSV